MELLTAEEVSKLFKCSQEFVYKNRSLLGGIKIGRLVRFQLNKIKEVILNGNLQESRTMDAGFLETRKTMEARGVRNQTRSRRGRSQDKGVRQEDEHGLLMNGTKSSLKN
jgi:hypothetical protein